MTGTGESSPISLKGVRISGSSVAVGNGATAGNVTSGGAAGWESALAELRRQLAELRKSGEIPAETADESLERAGALEEELGRERPRKTVVFDLMANLAKALEGVAGIGNAVALVTDAVRAVFSG